MQMKFLATGLIVVLGLAGCQRASYDYNQPSNNGYMQPLQAQPVPSVQSGELPPPGGMAGQFPTAPANSAPMGTEMASAAPASALDVTKESMVGNWRVANAGANCDMFLTLTNLGSGSRGGTRGCAGELTSMGSWEVSGKMVVFKDRNGNAIGRVYKTAGTQFDGTTSSGQPLQLSRQQLLNELRVSNPQFLYVSTVMKPVPDYNHSVVERLNSMTTNGELQEDKAQLHVAELLDQVLLDLKSKRSAQKKSALGWLFGKKTGRNNEIQGLYVYGSVGRGKTMLMDMFFEMAPIVSKRRCHFHEFMADVHNRVHIYRQKLKNGEVKNADPIPPVAAELLAEAELLCFDEFTVTDIADAMILARLFTELFAKGCILVTTSNVIPDNLYKDGLNRSLFLPFVELLKQHVTVTTLDSPTDYRMEKVVSLPVYVTPLGDEAQKNMDLAWRHLTSGLVVKPMEIEMKGRSIHVPHAAGRIGRFDFADLCEKPLGASDFIKIASEFDTIFIDNIPYLNAEKRNETKRFIILIDALYDATVRLFASAAAMPENLLAIRKGTEGFEFDRTASRLFEMRSQDYLDRHLLNRRQVIYYCVFLTFT